METTKRPFRFGITSFGPTKAAWQDAARRAEDIGFSTLVIPDHFGPQYAPVPALVAAAAATTRLRVGTLVFDNDFRNPAVLAKEAATVDVMTDGRFELGIGAGWMEADYEKTGITMEAAGVRVSKLEETLRILKAFFRDELVNFDGAYYHVRGLEAMPRPVQPSGPPIVMGASGKRMLSIIGREADIASVQGHPDPPNNFWGAVTAERFVEQLGIIRQAAGARYPDIEISILADIHLSDDRDAEIDKLAAQFGLDRETVMAMPAVFAGSADAIAEQLLERRERYGISYPVIVGQTMDAVAAIVARLAGK